MACARCDFYTPKGSSKGQLLEAKENLQTMLANILRVPKTPSMICDLQILTNGQ
ncbi:hypothetical protein ACFVW1_31600 [Streptomyces olivochromogenes]|uniref:hypothetical protein n=1 Tax=Streptomyces olivochromogenes TaxID=1963 RepID=UPI0036DEF362